MHLRLVLWKDSFATGTAECQEASRTRGIATRGQRGQWDRADPWCEGTDCMSVILAATSAGRKSFVTYRDTM
ncbi:hypothetical protein GCM10023159_17390 [Brevibacterium yomogidense]